MAINNSMTPEDERITDEIIKDHSHLLDLLANEYYQDIGLWWIISTANPDVIRRDSFGLKPGIEIRIPANVQGIIEAFEALNK